MRSGLAAKMRHMWPFGKSVLFGSVAGALPGIIIFILIGHAASSRNFYTAEFLWVILQFSMMLLSISFPVVLACTIVLCLPLTFILARQGWESEAAYVTPGLMMGSVIPGLYDTSFSALGIVGAFSGAVTGSTWWRAARDPQAGKASGY